MSAKAEFSRDSYSFNQKSNQVSKLKLSESENKQKGKKLEISKVQLKTHLIRKFRKANPQKVPKQRRFTNILFNGTQSISDEGNFTCPICLQILINPIIFQCGHFGCLKCIETVSVYQNKCFLCRKVLQNLQYKPSTVISAIINKNVVKNIDNPIEFYSRLGDHLQWHQKKQLKIEQLQIGSFVDVRCILSGKWKNGVLISVETPQNSNYMLLIKYKNETEFNIQLIDIFSSRLAKHGFYTQKRAIQTSNHQQEEIQVDIPQILIENFQNVQMDRNTFFIGIKQENYFSQVFGVGDNLEVDQKPKTHEFLNEQEAQNQFKRDLQQLLNPYMEQGFLVPELLDAQY